MSAYRSIAFVGFGATSELLTNHFLDNAPRGQYTYRVLTRAGKDLSPKLVALKSKGVAIHTVDYESPSSLEAALKGVDVVISGLRDDGLHVQFAVARAAKKAGARLFIPSEFGKDSRGETSAYLKPKADLHVLLKELDLPYTLYFTGFFPETVSLVGGAMGLDFVNGKFAVSEGGKGYSSFTDPRSFVPYIYWSLTTLSPSELEWRVFQIEAERKSILDLIADWEKKSGKKADVHHRTPAEHAEFRKVMDTIPGLDFLSVALTRGAALDAPDGYQIWPQWGPIIKAIDVIAPSV